LELWAMADINRWKPDCWNWCNEISSTGVLWLKVWVKRDRHYSIVGAHWYEKTVP